MTDTTAEPLAGELHATAGFSPAAARLLLRLSELRALPLAALATDARAAAAELRVRGAAVYAGGVLRPHPASWRLARHAARGTRLCVQRCGRGPALLLAAPFGAARGIWGTPWDAAQPLARLARDYETICIDYRGTGCSDVTPEPYSLEELALDLDAALDGLGVARAHVCGVSLGGAVALRLALARPARVASLVLCAATADELDAPTRAKAATFLALAATQPLEWALRTYLRSPLAGATPATLAGMLAVGRRGLRTRDNFINCYRASVFRTSIRGRLGALRHPTLVMVGADDAPYFHEQARVLAAGIAGAALVTVPGAGHVVSSRQPAIFTRVVRDFLARHPYAAAPAGGARAAAVRT